MAANDAVIVITGGKPQAQKLVTLSNQARDLHIELTAYKAQLDHLTDGASDYAGIVTQCGVTVGNAPSVYAAIGAIVTLLNDANFKALAYQVQQQSPVLFPH